MKTQKTHENPTFGNSLTNSLFRKIVNNKSIIEEEESSCGENILYVNSYYSNNENLRNKIIGMSVLEIIC